MVSYCPANVYCDQRTRWLTAIIAAPPALPLLIKLLCHLGVVERLGPAHRMDLQETRAIDKMLAPLIREHRSSKGKHLTFGDTQN